MKFITLLGSNFVLSRKKEGWFIHIWNRFYSVMYGLFCSTFHEINGLAIRSSVKYRETRLKGLDHCEILKKSFFSIGLKNPLNPVE